ncbi:MAG TPA: hypothetical protein VF686_01715, partial [Brevundimonas sp.]
IRDRSGPRGLVMIGRAANDTGFTPLDQRRILAMRPWLLHALDATPTAEFSTVEAGDEAILLCDHQGLVVQMGPNAAKLLLYAGNGRIAQREVAVGIGLGRPAERVQAELGLTAGTFGRHLEDIHERLGVRSRSELMTTLMGHRTAGSG